MERAGTAAKNSPPSFTLSFFPFSAGPRPGCFWIQRAERRNQRSSVCVDDSLDNQLVSKLPDGRRTKLKILLLLSFRLCLSTLSVHFFRSPARTISRGLAVNSRRIFRSSFPIDRDVSRFSSRRVTSSSIIVIRFLKDSNSF